MKRNIVWLSFVTLGLLASCGGAGNEVVDSTSTSTLSSSVAQSQTSEKESLSSVEDLSSEASSSVPEGAEYSLTCYSDKSAFIPKASVAFTGSTTMNMTGNMLSFSFSLGFTNCSNDAMSLTLSDIKMTNSESHQEWTNSDFNVKINNSLVKEDTVVSLRSGKKMVMDFNGSFTDDNTSDTSYYIITMTVTDSLTNNVYHLTAHRQDEMYCYAVNRADIYNNQDYTSDDGLKFSCSGTVDKEGKNSFEADLDLTVNIENNTGKDLSYFVQLGFIYNSDGSDTVESMSTYLNVDGENIYYYDSDNYTLKSGSKAYRQIKTTSYSCYESSLPLTSWIHFYDKTNEKQYRISVHFTDFVE